MIEVIDYSIKNRNYKKGQRIRTDVFGHKYDIGTIIFYSERCGTFLVSFDQKTINRLGVLRFHRGRHYDILGFICDTNTCNWVSPHRLQILTSDSLLFNDKEYEDMLV